MVFWVFFSGEFSRPGNKKKGGLANPTKGILKFKNKIIIFQEKKLEIATFRQHVPLGHQN
jgi:hypothetical protein